MKSRISNGTWTRKILESGHVGHNTWRTSYTESVLNDPSIHTVRCELADGTTAEMPRLAVLQSLATAPLKNGQRGPVNLNPVASTLWGQAVPMVVIPAGVLAPANPPQPLVSLVAPPGSGPAYQPDEKIRKAVEIHGVEVAEELYRSHGYVTTRRGKPYDLDAVRADESRHIEVKGFQDAAPTEVILTANEVAHARQQKFMLDLVVVAGITVADVSGTVIASGGKVYRHLENWIPAPDSLVPTHYQYRLPEAP